MSNERDSRHLNDDYSSGLGPPFIHAGPQETQYLSNFLPSSNYPNYDHPNLAPQGTLQGDQARSGFTGYAGGTPSSNQRFDQRYDSFLPNFGSSPASQSHPSSVNAYSGAIPPATYQYDGFAHVNPTPGQARQTGHTGKWDCPKCTFKCDEHWQLTQHLDKAHSLGADILGFEPDKGKIHWDGRTYVTKEQQQQKRMQEQQEMMQRAGTGRTGPPRVGPAPSPHFFGHH